jgi:hypothetical protein
MAGLNLPTYLKGPEGAETPSEPKNEEKTN